MLMEGDSLDVIGFHICIYRFYTYARGFFFKVSWRLIDFSLRVCIYVLMEVVLIKDLFLHCVYIHASHGVG